MCLRIILGPSLILVAFGSAREGHAHGEDRPGPHGGIIRMPGAFHTELRPKSNREFELFLLDMKWGEPSVAQSSVEAASKLPGVAP